MKQVFSLSVFFTESLQVWVRAVTPISDRFANAQKDKDKDKDKPVYEFADTSLKDRSIIVQLLAKVFTTCISNCSKYRQNTKLTTID